MRQMLPPSEPRRRDSGHVTSTAGPHQGHCAQRSAILTCERATPSIEFSGWRDGVATVWLARGIGVVGEMRYHCFSRRNPRRYWVQVSPFERTYSCLSPCLKSILLIQTFTLAQSLALSLPISTGRQTKATRHRTFSFQYFPLLGHGRANQLTR